ncbi:MAG TPA: ComEC/Rec2 family competence protein [Polyangiaceae bacterium]|nr:ComEC/Rec2 family competence protein [Polyangiaceae bacterium]
MIDGVLVIGLALLAGQRGAVAPFEATIACLGALALALARGRVGRAAAACALVAALAGALRARDALARYERSYAAARDALGPPSRCEADAVVRTSPVRQGDTLRWTAEAGRLACDERAIEGPLVLTLYGGPEGLARGDRVAVVADLAPPHLFANADLPDPRPAAARKGSVLSGGVVTLEPLAGGRGPGAWVDRARARVRGRIEATFPAAAAPMARALVLGETDLDPGDDEAFRRSGLSHLLAVSGTHLVLAVVGALRALRWLLVRVPTLAARGDLGRALAPAGAALAFAYADFAGGSGSAARAALMLACGFGAVRLGRRPDATRALGLSLLAFGALDPLVAFDWSFLLSAAATGGLLALSPPVAEWLRERLPALAAPLVPTLSATLAASAACAPLTAALSPSVPLAGVLANLVAVPLGELFALPLCLLHALLAFAPPLERAVAWAAAGSLLAVRAVAHAASGPLTALPAPSPGPAHALALGLGALGAALARPGRRAPWAALTASALLAAEIYAIRAGEPRGRLRVTALDVGQGDSLLVDLPDGRLMAVDGGGMVGSPFDPGLAVLVPTLRERRRPRVDVAVLSHPHPDHFLGLASALPRLEVGELWDTGQGEDEGAGPAYAALLAGLRARGVPVVRPDALCGAPRDFGGATLRVLSPCPAFKPFGSANDNSLVVHIAYGRRAVLLTGDAEHEAEAALVERFGASLRADLLKVGHHGSRTSTGAALLAAVRPSLALASCGVRNRFGHPHPTALARLAAAGVPLARTDRGGALVWETDGESIRTRRARGAVR